MSCPNKSHPQYKELMATYGEGRALAAWTLNNEQVPTVEQAAVLLGIQNPNTVNSTLKVVEALGTDKVQKLYDKFYKSNPEKFYSELIPLVGKQQVEILRDYNNKSNPISLQDMLTGIMSEMAYTVEVNTAKGGIKGVGNDIDPFTGAPLTTEIDKNFNTQYYSNLTVPGGTNYTENEIATPSITPSIKGHAQFSTDNGIGWHRADEQINYKSVDDAIQVLKQSGRLKIIC